MESDIKIESFTGYRLFERMTECEAIIDGYLWDRDVVMLLGSEKAGKSILALQMASAISSGGLFLGKYQCKKEVVVYLQTEGKKDETAMRLENMSKAVSINPTFFHRMYKKFMPFNIPEYVTALEYEFQRMMIAPKVLIIDCLYMAMVGDLNSNTDVRAFIAALSSLLERYKMTCILVHHSKRDEYFQGEQVTKGDKSSYGSVFLRANVDHIIFLDMKKDKTRTLGCDTQRSGKVVEKESLVLVEPNPLLFKIASGFSGVEETILHHCSVKPHSKTEMEKVSGYSESTIDRSVRVLVSSGKLNIVNEVKNDRGSYTKMYGVLNQSLKQGDDRDTL